MIKQFVKPILVTATVINLSVNGAPIVYASVPNPDDVAGLSTFSSTFKDFDRVSDYAKKAIVRFERLGLLIGQKKFFPQQPADKTFARQLLGTLDDLGYGDVTYAEAKQLISTYAENHGNGVCGVMIFSPR